MDGEGEILDASLKGTRKGGLSNSFGGSRPNDMQS